MNFKINIKILFLFLPILTFPQGEASIWYFGYNAGIKFNTDGSVTALTDGQLATLEGCATLSDASGQLLFYTDGITVYNKNHQIMANGSGLMGDPSSTQSATIVKKPGSTNLFYVFTTDREHEPNGFRYSIIDLNLNNGLGDVTAQKNILVYTPTIESIGITKHANGIDFWVVTHSWDNNNFNAHILSASGLSSTPIITPIGLPITGIGFQAAGHIKFSPSGKKLAITSTSDFVQLFDFNNVTGVLSNPQTLLTETGELYGVAFSPNEKVLYVTQSFGGKLYQFNLEAGDIPNSKITIYTGTTSNRVGALQIGPDNKIYVAQFNLAKLGVIHNPNVVGTGCNFQFSAIDLAGKLSKSGLPSFNQSFFFTPTISFQNACVGQSTTFEFNTNQPVISATWTFGDGNSSNSIIGNNIYNSTGVFPVTVNVVTPYGTGTATQNITVSVPPTATQPTNILLCDTDSDGFTSFDLTTKSNVILNGQSSATHIVKYFASASDYSNNVSISAPSSYINLAAFGSQTIIAEVNNGTCKQTTSFTIQVFSPTATIVAPAIRNCDNTSFGTNNDGKIIFNLTQNNSIILGGQPTSDFTINYYHDSALTQLISNPSSYVNTNIVETIYVKVVNNLNTTCFGTTSFQIEVFSLPIINSIVTLKQCDDNNDGFSAFNLKEAENAFVASTTGLTFTYFENSTDAQNNNTIASITSPTAYINQVVSNDVVYVRVENVHGCFRVGTLNLNVSTTSIPSSFQKVFTVCDDALSGSNTDGIATFNFSSVTTQIQALYPAGQLLTIKYYKNQADALAEQNAIANTSNYTNLGYPITQNIYVRVDSQVNNDCLGLGHHITLHVERIPFIENIVLNHCDDNQDGIFGFDTSNLQTTLLNGLTNVSITYKDQNGNALPSPLPNPFVTSSQTITARATNNTTTACYDEATIQFIVDDLPEAFPIASTLTIVCDDEVNPLLQDGLFSFNTSTFQTTILGSQSGMLVNYYAANGAALPSPLPNPFTTTTQTITAEVINPINTTCKATLSIPFVVKPTPRINTVGTELVCSNNPNFIKTIDAGLEDVSIINNFSYQWFLDGTILSGETNYSLVINTEGSYKVVVTNAQNCTKTRTITVTASNIATIENIVINDLSDNNSILVNVSGSGDYEYSLDGENYQISNIFYNVSSGLYTVYVKDTNDCGIAEKDISLLGIPNYFTPNNDGYNDYWNINGVSTTYNAKTTIYIFDRYGKLIKEILPLSKGWDGTYNGKNAPSSDYWYVINLEDGRTFKGHFSLKR
ncbi:T9SS type B sorting domain-containing protein [Flavobacterium sp.]|jgi:gliding motility-associated-like protein|uniref:T9SS type B sorting domain-containing protein n=1 Tax=Flavobacterium sp. TaxID=239 RepID=UPI0037C1B1CD